MNMNASKPNEMPLHLLQYSQLIKNIHEIRCSLLSKTPLRSKNIQNQKNLAPIALKKNKI